MRQQQVEGGDDILRVFEKILETTIKMWHQDTGWEWLCNCGSLLNRTYEDRCLSQVNFLVDETRNALRGNAPDLIKAGALCGELLCAVNRINFEWIGFFVSTHNGLLRAIEGRRSATN